MTRTGQRAGALVLGRWDGPALLAMLEETGALSVLARRGFADLAFEIDAGDGALTHARLHGAKGGARHLLVDACLTTVRLEEKDRPRCHYGGPAPLDLVVVYWLREQDPTAAFDPAHPRLPLQQHPGLGVLRRMAGVAVRMAGELGCDGVAALPKFFHDAVLFHRSRFFLFLDPAEQGRFDALLRDLEPLSLPDATLALGGAAVRDAAGEVAPWQAGLQVMALSSPLSGWFASPAYRDARAAAFAASRFHVDAGALAAARELFAREPAVAGA